MSKLTIAENVADPSTWETVDVENMVDFLIERYLEFPENARIYLNDVNYTSDITPSNEHDIDELLKMDGHFYVVIYPSWQAVPYILMALVAVVSILNQPKIPVATVRAGSESPSSNNEISDRSNKSRINARIPDIFGEVRSVPDMLTVPYKIFENQVEVEHSYMCVGRGSYEIKRENIFEETTPVTQISGMSLEVYGPGNSPNHGTAELTIGGKINLPIKLVNRYTSVSGQTVDNISASEMTADGFEFTAMGTIKSINPGYYNLNAYFRTGDSIVCSAVVIVYHPGEPPTQDNPYGTPGWEETTFDFSGTYLITNVTDSEITLDQPWLINSDWNAIPDKIQPTGGTIRNKLNIGVGPFVCDRPDIEEIWLNFIAPNGIYKDDGTTRTSFPVEFSITVTPINENSDPIGPEEKFPFIMQWNGSNRINFGATAKIKPSFVGRCSVSAVRISPKGYFPGFQVSDEVKWRDLYSISPIDKTEFGDITTIQTITKASDTSLDIRQRKLNAIVTRKIPRQVSGNIFSQELMPSKSADDIISAICLDPKIGNRSLPEIDFDNIYQTVANIKSYFGTSKAAEFCYTFDTTNLSFEETLYSIASSIFCLAYRRGSQLKLSFEKVNDIPTILFNHRNKIPRSETRTVSFGNVNDNDGVEFQYVDPKDDSIISIYIPSDQSATNPKTVESVGIRNKEQATLAAYRIYNKILFQNTNIVFEATQEANIALINDKILVSDSTRSGTFDGEVISQNVLELTLSQSLDLIDGRNYTIFLQLSDGTVESIPVGKTEFKNKILLSKAPSLPLCLDYDLFAKTTFTIVENNDTRINSFIVSEKRPKGVLTCEVVAVNYDPRYYQNDKDFA